MLDKLDLLEMLYRHPIGYANDRWAIWRPTLDLLLTEGTVVLHEDGLCRLSVPHRVHMKLLRSQ